MAVALVLRACGAAVPASPRTMMSLGVTFVPEAIPASGTVDSDAALLSLREFSYVPPDLAGRWSIGALDTPGMWHFAVDDGRCDLRLDLEALPSAGRAAATAPPGGGRLATPA